MTHGTVRFEAGILTITAKLDGKEVVTAYKVEDVRPDKRIANPAYSLTKDDGTVYHVAVTQWGPACDCPDNTYRRERTGEACKHLRACMAVGLIPETPYREG